MNATTTLRALLTALVFVSCPPTYAASRPVRLVILKVDGLNADLLYRTMAQTDPQSGRSVLPWIAHVFRDNGTIFQNFYTRGISLSAPSWSMLDTGRHSIIRGNVEYDRYTGFVYDYLNFFPLYLNSARNQREDMPGVRVLDRAGIPLLIDQYLYPEVFQSFQLYQRGIRWGTLEGILGKRLLSQSLLSLVENGSGPSADELLAGQTERDLIVETQTPEVLYLDYYTGDIDHEAHATNNGAALAERLKALDALTGRIWTALERTKATNPYILVMVSDHGMNNVPGVFSQAFSLPDLLNSPQGGGHHVVTNRYQLSDYKLMGLNPLVERVVTPSTASPYLAGESARYPTAWLDLDGNERASLHLRNSDLNKLHILLLALAANGTKSDKRRAAAQGILTIVDRNRSLWIAECEEIDRELAVLQEQIQRRRILLDREPKKWSKQQVSDGARSEARRLESQLQDWGRERSEYRSYFDHVKALLALKIDPQQPFTQKISDLIPELALGDNNSIYQLQHYAAGPAKDGVVLNGAGNFDEEASFRYIDYVALLASQRVRNNPQAALSPRPIDFVAMRLPAGSVADAAQAYWLAADEKNQILILVNENHDTTLRPVSGLRQDYQGNVSFQPQTWRPNLPLHLFEDQELQLGTRTDRGAWLSVWHSEKEWFAATHRCLYSNGVIGITEQLSPVSDNVPGTPGMPPAMLQYERHRRELVQPDLQIFAANHWNFNARNFNPGGNHGGFFRISTHSVWMMAGQSVPVRTMDDPYDSLNFASTILQLAGKRPPMPQRVVDLERTRETVAGARMCVPCALH